MKDASVVCPKGNFVFDANFDILANGVTSKEAN